MHPILRCQQGELTDLARRYQYPLKETELLALKPTIVARGCMTRDELIQVVRWKAPRVIHHVERNTEESVTQVTRLALHAAAEEERIRKLTDLHGVGWPMASVILHFFHRERYPILDFRALWTVSLPHPTYYKFDFWWQYVKFCRQLADRTGLDMRTLDRALWQYSKEKQPPE